MRYRLTIRGASIELRGIFTENADEPGLVNLAKAMEPFGMVIASPLEEDVDLYYGEPNMEASLQIVQATWERSGSTAAFLAAMAQLHYMQAMVIRGERDGHAEVQDRIDRALEALDSAGADTALGILMGLDKMQEAGEWSAQSTSDM